jgi:hypothetical protein
VFNQFVIYRDKKLSFVCVFRAPLHRGVCRVNKGWKSSHGAEAAADACCNTLFHYYGVATLTWLQSRGVDVAALAGDDALLHPHI